MRDVSSSLNRGRFFTPLVAFAWVTAVGCATAAPPADVEIAGEGGAANGGAASGGQSGGVLGTGGSVTFVQGGSAALGGALARGGGTSGTFGSGGKSSAGAGGATGGSAGAGTAGLAKGGTTASGGIASTGGASKGGAPSAGASSGGVSSGGVSGKGGATSAGSAGVLGSGGGAAKGELFFDDFETGKASRWVQSPAGSNWAVVADGTNVYKEQTLTSSQLIAAAGDSAWADQIVEARVKVVQFSGQSTSYYAAVCARVRDANNFYAVTLSSDGKLSFRVNTAGSTAKVGPQYTVPGGVTTGTWYTVRFEVRGNVLSATLNGIAAGSHTVTSNAIATGGVGLVTYNTIAVFDDVRVTAP